MRYLIIVLIVSLSATFSLQAQGVAKKAQNIAVKLDKSTGKIDLFNTKNNTAVTNNYKLSHLELEIYDSGGEYAGSLELKDFLLPKNEVDKSEKVKIAQIRFKNISTGELLMLSNVDFIK
jgi:hypothetical protein